MKSLFICKKKMFIILFFKYSGHILIESISRIYGDS